MALVAIVGGLWIPYAPAFAATAPAFTSKLMDASAEGVAAIIEVPKTGTLDKFEWLAGTVTLNANSQIRSSFQDVSLTTGAPDGTVDQFRNTAGSGISTNTWTVPGLITSDGTDTGAKRSVTRGGFLACVIDYSTFTAGDVLNVQTLSTDDIAALASGGIPYTMQFTGAGPWADQTQQPIVGLKYNDGTYAYVGGVTYPIQALNTVLFNSASTPDERGSIIRFPAPVRVGAAWVRIDLDGDADLVLYDSDGITALETVSMDKDVRQGLVGRTRQIRFATDRALLANTNYRLVVKPTSVTDLTIYDFDVNAAALLDGVEGGQTWQYTQRTDAGAWTQTVTKRPWMGVLVTHIDDGAGVLAAGLIDNGFVGRRYV